MDREKLGLEENYPTFKITGTLAHGRLGWLKPAATSSFLYKRGTPCERSWEISCR
jgi:hypothetical protein